MKKKLAIIFILPLLLTGFHAVMPEINQAEAARIGGGRSFGSRPGLNRSAPAPQRNLQQNQAAPGAAPLGARGGMLGGFLGPLLMGSMLGALLFGGAFSGIGAIDLLVIGLLVYFVVRMLRRRTAAAPSGQSSQSGHARTTSGSGQDAWGHLRSPGTSASSTAGFQAEQAQRLNLPADFDTEKFLEGAKLMYARMQESWDKRDLSDISEFTTPGMYRVIKEQAAEDPEPSQTEVLTLNAQLYSFAQEKDEENIAVYFDAMLREYADKGADYAREIWHFARPKGGGSWKLDGIQQVE